MAVKAHSDIVELGVPAKVLSAHIHILRLGLMEGQVTVLYCRPQELTGDRGIVFGHILQALKVALVRGDDHTLVLTDFFRNPQVLGHHIDQGDPEGDTHFHSRIPVAVVPVLVSTLLPSHQLQRLLPWVPTESLLFHSHLCLSQDLVHRIRPWVLPCRIHVVGRTLLCPYFEILGNS